MENLSVNHNHQIAWNEYGAPDGEPVFYFHGTPGSQLEAFPADQAARDLGIRLICPERPGYGDSASQIDFSLLDWPNALTQLADKLKLNNFSILAYSAGGPYALACAHEIPEHIKHITLVGCTAPFETDVMQDYICADFKPLYELSATDYPSAIDQVSQLARSPEVLFDVLQGPLPVVDKAIFNQKAFQKHYLKNLTHALNTGANGIVNDLCCLAQPWQFSLQDIELHVDIWHGHDDKNVGIAVAEYLANTLKSTSTHYLDDCGHYFLFNNWYEVLTRIKTQGFVADEVAD